MKTKICSTYSKLPLAIALITTILLSANIQPAFSDNHSTEAEPSDTSENYEYSGWTAGIGSGAYFYEGDESINSSFIVEGRLGKDLCDSITLETSLGYLPYIDSRSNASKDPNAWHLDSLWGLRGAVDVIYHLNEKSDRQWDPTLGITGGTMYYSNTLDNDQHFDAFGGLGGGLAYALNRNWLARGDYRVVAAGSDTQINHQVLLSLGYRWGSAIVSGSGSDSDVGMGDLDADSNLKPVYFDFDKSNLSEDAQNTLNNNAAYLKQNPDLDVMLEGNCDERGTSEYNYALGEKRAHATKQYLEALGVDSERMGTISYGEDRPVDAGHTEEAWKLNRRVDCKPKK